MNKRSRKWHFDRYLWLAAAIGSLVTVVLQLIWPWFKDLMDTSGGDTGMFLLSMSLRIVMVGAICYWLAPALRRTFAN